MINTHPDYFGMMLYGGEQARSVAEPGTFPLLAETLHSVFESHSIRARCRGRVSGPLGKNASPKSGPWSGPMLESWKTALKRLGEANFCRFELFGPIWRPGQHPLAYAAIDKMQRVRPDLPPERFHAGAGNSITLALHKDILKLSLGELESLCKELALLNSTFYGYINPSDAWDYGRGAGTARFWLMDIRFRDIIQHKYRRGRLRMTHCIPDLYVGNILSDRHFAAGDPSCIVGSENLCAEAWPCGLTYVRFLKDPQKDGALRNSALKYFNVVA